ncbi:Putative zinc-finger [Catalinimonas alkaloidigena]|uniref:Putative zinc-finger n=1 Tax=Catalinimonas alkaloidigena TaxID=1075417 RepID=A0A1G9KN31_9BACT|nr:HEAT repeat domain-containing protein [Catalinimonas alkaloidigena]SDL51112.1 Putative zinc-finger [Catalinimonas alkaloidigena]
MEKPITCEAVKERLVDWCTDQLPPPEQLRLEAHIATCGDCREELHAVRHLWRHLGHLPAPQPSDQARVRFDAMLTTFKAQEATRWQASDWWAQLVSWVVSPPVVRLAYSVCLIGVGLAAGYFLNHPPATNPAQQDQIQALTSEVQQMQELMMLSLLENPSASERLRAVSYTKEIHQVDDRVLEALLTTLNRDPNVNVRLVTLEALVALADDPHVREGLVKSLSHQESPLVQAALADAMVQLQEKRSVDALRQLLQQDNLNDLVKTKIEKSLQALSEA